MAFTKRMFLPSVDDAARAAASVAATKADALRAELIAAGVLTGSAPTPAPAPTLTTIQSASLAADGLTLTLNLNQPATIAGTLALLVDGTGRSVTWTTPGTASATRTGTLAGAVQAGQVVTFSAAAGFTSPALAAAITGRAVTNNSTVAAAPPPPANTTPTLLASFAGPAGSQPTGANAITSTGIFTDNAQAVNALDGNGNLSLGVGASITVLSASDVVAGGTIRITLASPGKLGFAPRMTSKTSTANAYFVGTQSNGAAFIGMIANGAFSSVLNPAGVVLPNAKVWDMNITDARMEIVADGVSLVTISNTQFPNAGFFGFRSIGSTPALVSKIESLTAAQAAAIYSAAHPPTMTIVGVS